MHGRPPFANPRYTNLAYTELRPNASGQLMTGAPGSKGVSGRSTLDLMGLEAEHGQVAR
jgi:hypothetical protein